MKRFYTGDRVRFVWKHATTSPSTGTVEAVRYHVPRGETEKIGVADVLVDDGVRLAIHTADLTGIDRKATKRLRIAGTIMLRALEAVSNRLGQCPPGSEDHDLAMMVRKAIILTREE